MKNPAEIVKMVKPEPKVEEYAKSLFKDNYIFYKRSGKSAQCLCNHCGAEYTIKTEGTGDYFEDVMLYIEKPERDKITVCRKCKAPAKYEPKGSFKTRYTYNTIVSGQKIDDENFVFRVYSITKISRKNLLAEYNFYEYKRIVLQKGKKATGYDSYRPDIWFKGNRCINHYYTVYPKTYKEIKKTLMFKYVPKPEYDTIVDYYRAAARYPDMEMIIKTGMSELAFGLINEYSLNFNPRGKQIHDRLRINKNRLKSLTEAKGDRDLLRLYQLERLVRANWNDEELEFVKELKHEMYDIRRVKTILNYASPLKLKHYFEKQKLDFDSVEDYKTRRQKDEVRREYFDYLDMKAASGYDMTNEITLFPKEIKRRHAEAVLEREQKALDKRCQLALERYPLIKKKYKSLMNKYGAAAGGYIIRPAKDASEIVLEGKILHHCVGGDNYLTSHNRGNSFILFLRPIKDKDIPYITVEIRGNKIVQWYGAYDKKPEEAKMNKWLSTYTKELEKRTKMSKNDNKKSKIVKNRQKTA